MYTGNKEADSNSNRNYSCRQIALADSVQFKHYNACTQTAIRFFCREIQNFTIVPKRLFIILQRNAKFSNCTQTAIRIFHKEIQNVTIYHQFSFVS